MDSVTKLMTKWLLFINRFFKCPEHPFNMQNNGKKSYALWQFEKGKDTISFYMNYIDTDNMFKDKDVLDIGCGAAGKSLYYLTLGAKSVCGTDIVKKYEKEAYELQKKLGLSGFSFYVADAGNTNFKENSFDVVIMNDAMEHIDKPDAVLKEIYRILKPHGKLFVNFPPYNHPYGAHLSDAIGIPWVHKFFNDKTLIEAYKFLVCDLSDGKERIELRISENEKGEEYFSYINKMNIKRFKKLVDNTAFKIDYYHEVPLRSILKPFLKFQSIKDYFVRMVVCVLEK